MKTLLNKKSNLIITTVIGCILFLFWGMGVHAGTEKDILSINTNIDSISIYVSNVDPTETPACITGTEEAVITAVEPISTLQVALRTLILVDNSASISEINRQKTKQLLYNLVATKLPNEEISIATIGVDVKYLCNYTSDGLALNTAIDAIEYQNQDVYLENTVYNLLSTRMNIAEDMYRRMIIISDGEDDNPVGYTEDEMTRMLETSYIPIYSIGCAKSNGTANLDYLFSFSRKTKADYFMLDQFDNVEDINAMLDASKNITKYTVVPASSVMDGTTKALQLTVGTNVFNAECKMPQVAAGSSIITGSGVDANSEVDSEDSDDNDEDDEDDEDKRNVFVYILIGSVALIIIIVVVSTIMKITKGDKTSTYIPSDDDRHNHGSDDHIYKNSTGSDSGTVMFEDEGATALVDEDDDKTEVDDSTALINEYEQRRSVILTDINNPAKVFMFSVGNPVILGRDANKTDVCIDYDKSVSHTHCKIEATGNGFSITDVGSANGTFINGTRVNGNCVEINAGDVLKLGRLSFRFDIE